MGTGTSIRIFFVSTSIILSLFIFQNGFLLKRQEIQSKSSCLDAKGGNGEGSCWMEPQYKRIILVLVDALRYDFIQPVSIKPSTDEKHFRGQMRHVSELVKSGKASIGTLMADPPTTTLQRLKALTTGTLPTFIDAGDNFSPDAHVNEDSFLYQANALNRQVTLLGDDTWLSLYPKMFTKTAAYDSFDINDLSTVDDNIIPIFKSEVGSSNSSLIIAHFLGVDHCGHKFGPKHPVMGEMLRKMDNIIGNTAEDMKDDDLLVVIGDHGMTSTGDHGGESELEIKAGVMVYTKNKKINLPTNPIHQIDIVPTISLLLGLPIPFSNLGTVIIEMFDKRLKETAVAMNYEQIKRFAETYSNLKGFHSLHSHTAREANSVEEQLNMMRRIQTALRIAWTQFDNRLIGAGILGLFETILFLVTNEKMSLEWFVVRSGYILLQITILSEETDDISSAHTLLMMALSVSCISSLFSMAWQALKFKWNIGFRISSRFLGYFAVILHSVSLFSNSFVVYEANVTRFLIQSILVVVLIEKIRWKPKQRTTLSSVLWNVVTSSEVSKFFILICGLRSEEYFHRCREEEVGCVQYYAATAAASLSSTFIISVVPTKYWRIFSEDAQIYRLITAAISIFSLNYYVNRRILKLSGTGRILKALTWPLLSLVIFHSILQNLLNLTSKANNVAQIVYLISFMGTFVSYFENTGKSLALNFLLVPVYLLLGDGIQPAVVILFIFVELFIDFVPKDTLPSVIALFIPFGFYLTGHSPVISSIPWTAAFIGVPGGQALRIIPAILVLLHINISVIFSIPMLFHQLNISRCSLALLTIRAMCACAAASIHRRHLMVWKIFAPKFIFEGVIFICFIIFLNFSVVFYSLVRKSL